MTDAQKDIADEDFSDRLNEVMDKCALSDEQVASDLAVSTPTIARWKAGRNLPHTGMRPRILVYLNERVGG